MTDAQKREYVSNLYSGPKWKKRVEKMPMGQVLAIYLDHQQTGTVPHHDEEGALLEQPNDRVIVLKELAPQDPHANEDLFDIY